MFTMSVIQFSVFLVVYYIVHSILTSHTVKQSLNFKGYRIMYNLFAIVSLFPFLLQLYQTIHLDTQIPLGVRIAGVLLISIGIIIHVATFKWFSSAVFIGLREESEENQTIITGGIYSTSRHPFYLGTLLIFWGLFIVFPNVYFLSFAVISTAYVFVGGRLEENKLMVHHKEKYMAYRQTVPMLIPWKKPYEFLVYLFKKK